MKEHYVSYECAQALKRLGFDWYVRGYYFVGEYIPKVSEVTALNHNDTKKFKNVLSAPRLDQAAAWLRDKGIYVEPRFQYESAFKAIIQAPRLHKYMVVENIFNSFEQALSVGLDVALELLGKEDKQ